MVYIEDETCTKREMGVRKIVTNKTSGFPKLKGAMREKGFSQRQLAEKLGISVASLNSKVNGKVDFKVGEAKEISKILSLEDPETIFFGQ